MPGRYGGGKDIFGAPLAPAPSPAGPPVVFTKKKAGPTWPCPSWEVTCRCGRPFLVICPARPVDSRCSVCMGEPRAFIPSNAKFDPFTRRHFLPIEGEK